ncbi:hypothetical protein HZP16_08660 [Elizabethkingia anophelis]|uniref:HEPN domain-containing protein n=1 Tax=Elizabethkingia miricola TaxID=172045 RepID=UPI0021A2D43B|nr:HEPN domain-containing protein [Elizabethkingia miricola]MCT4326172.1 hypothetical protein [Elizabethkingia anophelis]WQM39395.1 hypothetical protein U2S95_03850 [Elizabethkingia miricola]
MRITQIKVYYEINFESELDIDFYFQNSHIYTISKQIYENVNPVNDNNYTSKQDVNNYLVIESTCEINHYDSINEASAVLRPRLLVLLGILSFFTNEAFLSYEWVNMSSYITNQHLHNLGNQTKFAVGKKKLVRDLQLLLNKIKDSTEEQKILIYTLFERFRKALHFEKESIGSDSYTDESILAYVHILEVLSDEYKDSFRRMIEQKNNELRTDLISLITNDPNNIPTKKIVKTINSLISNQITLRRKISQMLAELGLQNDKTDAIVGRFIEHRNSIAHGRKDLYQDRVIFPLKPFFSFVKNIYESPETIKLLSAVCISKYLGLLIWQKEWNFYIKNIEKTTIQSVKEFLKNKEYNNLIIEEFISGKINGITPNTIFYYFINGKVNYKDFEESMSIIKQVKRKTKKTCNALFDCCTVLSDSCDKQLARISKEIIITSYKKKYYPPSNIRDAIKELQYHKINAIWFENWLINNKPIKI